MIPVSPMTVGEAVNAVYARTANLVSPTNLDWGSVVQALVDARRELFVKTSPYGEWSFYASADLNHLQNVPADFIRPIRVMARPNGSLLADAEWVEARRADPREWRKTSVTPSSLSWVGATEVAPVYMIWANSDQTDTWSSTQMALWLAPSNMVGRLDYVASYSAVDIEESSDLVRVPVSTEHLLVDLAALRVLEEIASPDQAAVVARRVYSNLATYQASRISALSAEGESTESLPDGSPAQTISTTGGA